MKLSIIHLLSKSEVLNNAVFLYSSKQPFILECAKIFGIDSAHIVYTGSILKLLCTHGTEIPLSSANLVRHFFLSILVIMYWFLLQVVFFFLLPSDL